MLSCSIATYQWKPAHVTSVVPFDLLFTLDWSAGEHKEGADEAYHL